MSDRREMIAQGIEGCKLWTGRYLVGFDDATCTRQPANLPNHVSWSLGHCGLTMHRVAEKLDGREIPESDFVAGSATPSPGVRPERFAIASVAFDSMPTDDPTLYPGLVRAAAVYDAACDRLAAAVRGAAESTLDEMTSWGSTAQISLGMLALRIIFHNGDHTGQILDTRRALGMARVLK